MKFPGKRLIVEYKNRRVRKDAKSLWGDINLQEISKAIEDEAAPPPSSEPVRKSRNVATHKQSRLTVSMPAANESPSAMPENAATGRILPALNDAAPVLNEDRDERANVPNNIPNRETKISPIAKPETPDVTPPLTQVRPTVQKPEKPVVRAVIEADTDKTVEEILPPAAAALSPLAPEKVSVEPLRDAASDKHSTAETVDKKDPSVAGKKALKREVAARKPIKANKVESNVADSRNSAPSANTGFYSLPEAISDDLDALEKENAELRLRLVETLRKENLQLEQMMVRASSPIGE